MDLNIDDCYVAMKSREDWNSNNWRYASLLFGSLPYSLVFIRSPGSPNPGRTTEPPERKQASLPDTEHMVSSAPAIGLTPSDKRTLVLITDHPKIWRSAWAAGWASTREELARSCTSGECLGLVERRSQRDDVRYTLSEEGIGYGTHRNRAQLPNTRCIRNTELIKNKHKRCPHLGRRIETWVRQTRHADGVTWFLSELAEEARVTADSELTWAIPTSKTDQASTGGSRPSPRTRWATSSPTDSISPSTRNTSCAPATRRECWPTNVHGRQNRL